MTTNKLPIPYKTYRGRQVVDQKAMHVERTRYEERNNPFKYEDPHPHFEAVFIGYHTYYGHQMWQSQEYVDAKRYRDNERKKQRRKDNPEWAKAQDAKENRAKKERMGEDVYLADMRRRSRAQYANNPESYAIRASRYEKRIRELYAALPDNVKKEVDEIYELRRQLNEAASGAGMYGKGANNSAKRYAFAVDHIMPLNPAPILFNGTWQRPYSGLHAPQNLQILEASENLSKKNATPEQFA